MRRAGRLLAVLAAAAVAGRAAAGAPASKTEALLDPELEALYAARVLSGRAEAGPEDARELAPLRARPGVALDAALPLERFPTRQRYEALRRPRRGSPQASIPGPTLEAAGGAEAFDAWRTAVLALAADPAFAAHLKRKARRLAPSLERLRATAGRRHREAIERYTGLAVPLNLRLVPSPFAPPDSGARFGAVIAMTDHYELTSGQALLWRDEPPEAEDVGVWHELGHALADLLLAAYPDAARSALRAHDGCGQPRSQCVREDVNDALALRLVAQARGEDVAARLLEAGFGRPGVRPLLERLRRYEASRGRYPTLFEFYPELIGEPAGPDESRPGDEPTVTRLDRERLRALAERRRAATGD